MTVEEKTIETEIIYKGKIINLRKDLVTVKNGKKAYREIVEHPGAVAVIALTDNKEAVMVKQYRKAAEQVLLEIPAGKMEKGEDPEETAGRELREETGFIPKELKFLTSFYTSVGFADEKIHLYYAEKLAKGDADPDEDEAIEIEIIPLMKLKEMVFSNEIKDSKTIIGILAVCDMLKI